MSFRILLAIDSDSDVFCVTVIILPLNSGLRRNSHVLSRLRVFVLEPLGGEHIAAIIGNAWTTLATDDNRTIELTPDALEMLTRKASPSD